MKKLELRLKQRDRHFLKKLVGQGQHRSRETKRACLLLALDRGGEDSEVVKTLGMDRSTIWRIRKAYREKGLERALYDRARPGRPRKYHIQEQTEIVALACSGPPPGRQRWTLRLLTETARKQKGLGDLNRETVRLILKKTSVSLG